jgi:zinc-ribbon domain
MYCDRCGTQLPQGASFCSACGKPIQGATAASPGRLARHLQVVAILWLVYGALHVLAGIAVWTVGAVMLPHFLYGAPFHMFPFGWPFHRFVGGIFTGLAALMVLVALGGLAAGWGLLQRESWARGLALVVAVLALFNLPWGTALGIYTLWVLSPEQARQEYRRVAGGA